MKDITDTLQKSINERTSSPFILSLLTSWIVYNHKLIMILVTPEWGVEDKIIKMEPLINWANMFCWPLAGSLFFLGLWTMRVPYHAAWDWLSTIVKTNKDNIENAKGVEALKYELETASKVLTSFVDVTTVDLTTVRSIISDLQANPQGDFTIEFDNNSAQFCVNGQVLLSEPQERKGQIEKAMWIIRNLGIVEHNTVTDHYVLLNSKHSIYARNAIESADQKSASDLP